MNVLLFDLSNLMMRCLFAQTPGPEEKKFTMFKQTFLTSFMKVIKDNKPDKIIVVEDSESWRKEIYPQYKADRKAKREKSVVNFDAFFPVAAKFFASLSKAFRNIQFIRLPRCEADDIIASIVKNKPEWNIVNISSDTDFHQLYVYKNYRQYDGLKREFIECLNPEQELLLKIIRGDTTDFIPSLKKGIRTKTLISIINEDLDAWLKEENLTEQFDRNMKLISFACIPKELELEIMKQVNGFIPGKFNQHELFKLITLEGLPELMPLLSEYSEIINDMENRLKNIVAQPEIIKPAKTFNLHEVRDILFKSRENLTAFKNMMNVKPLNNGRGGCQITSDSVMEEAQDEKDFRTALLSVNPNLDIKNTNMINPYFKQGEPATNDFINFNCANGDFVVKYNGELLHFDLKIASKPIVPNTDTYFPSFVGGAIGDASIKYYADKPNHFYILMSMDCTWFSLVDGPTLVKYIKATRGSCYRYSQEKKHNFIAINRIPQNTYIDDELVDIWISVYARQSN